MEFSLQGSPSEDTPAAARLQAEKIVFFRHRFPLPYRFRPFCCRHQRRTGRLFLPRSFRTGKILFGNPLTNSAGCFILIKCRGPVAQLGERCVRIAEVKGSNPSRSTMKMPRSVTGAFYIFRKKGGFYGIPTD